MKIENITLIKLIASDGMVLTNGKIYGKEICIGINDSPDKWSEVPESDVPQEEDTEEENIII